MFETIKRLYKKTGDTTLVVNAVKKGWITEAQYKLITGEPYSVEVEEPVIENVETTVEEVPTEEPEVAEEPVAEEQL